jgi:uncharacterized protein (TIGR03083 family)
MDTEDTLSQACRALPPVTARLAELVESSPDLSIVARDSDWTIRQVAVHVATTAKYFAETVNVESPPAVGGLAGLHADIDRRAADISESDPVKLGALLRDAVDEFAEACAERPETHPVDFAGCPASLDALAGLMLGEVVLHGYDMAFALGGPWPIEPAHACLVLGAFAPLLGLIVDPERARGHSAAYGIELRGGPAMTARFTEGVYALEPPGPVDVTISADPVAFLLVAAGRLSRYEAIALGLMSADGRRPELALGFHDLFVNP